MRTDLIVQFAQQKFCNGSGVPADTFARPPVPAWVTDGASESAVLADGNDTVRVEGEIGPTDPILVASTTTADALAYYLPFHFYTKGWGIYVRAAGVWALAERLSPSAGSPALTTLNFSYQLLMAHERLHFFAEYAASRLELITDQSSYIEYFKDLDATYHEEALANAHSIKVVRRHSSKRLVSAAKSWMLTQPQGYCDFNNWIPPNFGTGQRKAAQLMMLPRALAYILANGPYPAEFLFFSISPLKCPVYIVLEPSVPWMRIAKPFPKMFGLQVYVFSHDHKPPHIHIDYPPGTSYTRYLWPALRPFSSKDPRLRSSAEKALRKYVDIYGSAIDRKIADVPWQ